MTIFNANFATILAAARAGTIALPSKALELEQSYNTLNAALTEAMRPGRAGMTGDLRVAAERALAADLVAALGKGAPMPADTGERAYAAQRAADVAAAYVSVLIAARGAAVDELGAVLAAAAPDVIRSLNPLLAGLVGEVAAALKIMGSTERSERAMLRADEPIRAAYLSLDGLTGRYNTLRHLRSCLLEARGEQVAPQILDVFGEVRNVAEIWPGWTTRDLGTPDPTDPHAPVSGAPWPANPAERLLWLASTPDLELWVPTASEIREAHRVATAARDAKRYAAARANPTGDPQHDPERQRQRREIVRLARIPGLVA